MAMSTEKARAFWVTGPGSGEIRGEALADPGPGELQVRTLYTGISRGTEALVFNGQVPVSEYQRMRAPFQAGDFPAPVKYGYINVGIVERGPPELVGREVFCLYPHQTRYVVPVDAVLPLPGNVPAQRAVLAANMQTALNGLWDAGIKIGDKVAVVGAGTVGCLIAWLAGRMPGCEVQLIDTDPGKAAVAARLGTTFRLPSEAQGEADVVVHASGSSAGLNTALELAGFESTVLEMSWFGTREVGLRLGEAFHSRRLRLIGSQVAVVAASQRSRWSSHRRNALALKLLHNDALDACLGGASRFEELPDVMARLSRSSAGTLCHLIDYED
jgi:threonine dehydrogenase-like Zn-dependent dehydrogenase